MSHSPSPSARRRTRRIVSRAGILSALALAVLTPSALAANDVYYAVDEGGLNPALGRVAQDAPGSSTIVGAMTGGVQPPSTIVTDETHVYGIPLGASAIRRFDRATASATNLTPNACSTNTSNGATSLESNSLALHDGHLYYICRQSVSMELVSKFIGRYDIAANSFDDDFMALDAGTASLRFLAVTSTHVFSANIGPTMGSTVMDEIVRMPIGDAAAATRIDAATAINAAVQGLAVTGSHVYWSTSNTSPSANLIARAALDLGSPERSWIDVDTAAGGSASVKRIAVSSTHVFWGADGAGAGDYTIGRATINGASPDNAWATPADPNPGSGTALTVHGIAVIGASAPTTTTTHDLTVTKSGTGAGGVTSSPAGIDCGATCKASFANGTSVTLTATAAAGSTFAGWSGACSGTSATCTVAVSAAATATATFTATSATVKGKPVFKKGNAMLTVDVPAPGTLKMVGTRPTRRTGRATTAPVCTATRTVSKAGRVKVTCAPNAATRRLLRKGKVKVSITLTFTSGAGTTATTKTTLTLPRRR